MGKGGLGCVFTPFIECADNPGMNAAAAIKPHVSKLAFGSEKSKANETADKEYAGAMLVRAVDPGSTFSVHTAGMCTPKLTADETANIQTACTLNSSQALSDKEIAYENGGESIALLLKAKPNVVPILYALQNIVKGIYKMNTASEPILHMDIKPDNIVIQDGLVRLIDFNLVRKQTYLKERFGTLIKPKGNKIWPPEWDVLLKFIRECMASYGKTDEEINKKYPARIPEVSNVSKTTTFLTRHCNGFALPFAENVAEMERTFKEKHTSLFAKRIDYRTHIKEIVSAFVEDFAPKLDVYSIGGVVIFLASKIDESEPNKVLKQKLYDWVSSAMNPNAYDRYTARGAYKAYKDIWEKDARPEKRAKKLEQEESMPSAAAEIPFAIPPPAAAAKRPRAVTFEEPSIHEISPILTAKSQGNKKTRVDTEGIDTERLLDDKIKNQIMYAVGYGTYLAVTIEFVKKDYSVSECKAAIERGLDAFKSYLNDQKIVKVWMKTEPANAGYNTIHPNGYCYYSHMAVLHAIAENPEFVPNLPLEISDPEQKIILENFITKLEKNQDKTKHTDYKTAQKEKLEGVRQAIPNYDKITNGFKLKEKYWGGMCFSEIDFKGIEHINVWQFNKKDRKTQGMPKEASAALEIVSGRGNMRHTLQELQKPSEVHICTIFGGSHYYFAADSDGKALLNYDWNSDLNKAISNLFNNIKTNFSLNTISENIFIKGFIPNKDSGSITIADSDEELQPPTVVKQSKRDKKIPAEIIVLEESDAEPPPKTRKPRIKAAVAASTISAKDIDMKKQLHNSRKHILQKLSESIRNISYLALLEEAAFTYCYMEEPNKDEDTMVLVKLAILFSTPPNKWVPNSASVYREIALQMVFLETLHVDDLDSLQSTALKSWIREKKIDAGAAAKGKESTDQLKLLTEIIKNSLVPAQPQPSAASAAAGSIRQSSMEDE